MEATAIWEQSLEIIKLNIPEQTYETWFKPTKGLDMSDSAFSIAVPNNFIEEWLRDKHLALISSTLKDITNRANLLVNFVVLKSLSKELAERGNKKVAAEITPPVATDTDEGKQSQLSDKGRTFDNFIVGASNQFAHAAAMAVAERPAVSYNPLFIYGGVGLGKTHLLYAVGQAIKKNNPQMRLIYSSAEQFCNEMISRIKNGTMPEFREKYRGVDVLLIDDIQFIAGKDRTEEEFFHTFNALFEARKQIVITSDRFPKDIQMIEDRLRSRFSWGLIADIQPPDLETRVAILEKKAEQDGKSLPRDVSNYIASKIQSNVRELEGSLTRLLAYSSLTNREITLPLAVEILKNTLNDKEKKVTPNSILKIVSDYYGVNVTELKSKKRTNAIARPRQISMYLCRSLTSMSLPEVGRLLGDRDHSTVIHACKQVEDRKEKSAEFASELETLADLIKREK